MKINKLTIYRLVADMNCGCKAEREYNDPAFKEPKDDTVFTSCSKHTGAPGVDMLEMMLVEYLEAEAEKAPEVAARPKFGGGGGNVVGVNSVDASTLTHPFVAPPNVRATPRDPNNVAYLDRSTPRVPGPDGKPVQSSLQRAKAIAGVKSDGGALAEDLLSEDDEDV